VAATTSEAQSLKAMKPRSRLLFSGASLPLTQASGSFIGLLPSESFINTYLFQKSVVPSDGDASHCR
jgi:hypothetical protein